MDPFVQHLHQTIATHQNFDQVFQVVEGVSQAVCSSVQYSAAKRNATLDELASVLQNHKIPVTSEAVLQQGQEDIPVNPNTPRLASRSSPVYRFLVFGKSGTGKTPWIHQVKMLLESPASALSPNEVLCTSSSGAQIHIVLYEISSTNNHLIDLENLRLSSHGSIVFYDSSSESSITFVHELVSQWSVIPSVLILVDNRPPSGDSKFTPRVRSAESIIISTAKKGNIAAPLQLAMRRALNDPLFSFELRSKPQIRASVTSSGTSPNAAVIAAAVAATPSTSTSLAVQGNTAKRTSPAKSHTSAPAEPLSGYAVWELDNRSNVKKAHPDLSNSALNRLLLSLWEKTSEVERERYGVLALKAQFIFAQGLSAELGTKTSPDPTSSDEESW